MTTPQTAPTAYAIVDVNGKQYKVEAGRYLDMDRLPNAESDSVTFDKVLMIVDGDKATVGAPFIEGASVVAKVLSHRRAKKIIVYKMRCKKGYRRKNGHRQQFSRVQIEQVKK